MKKLITMTEFVKELTHNKDVRFETHKRLERIITYCLILKTPLSLSQFIPCKDGEPMEKPDINTIIEHLDTCECGRCEEYYGLYEQYQKALESVLFEGWEIDKISNPFTYIREVECHKRTQIFKSSNGLKYRGEKTVEALINLGIELIPTEICKKQIGL